MCLHGLRLAGRMFQRAVGSVNGSFHEPLKCLRRGVEIQVIAPKVSPSHAAAASTAVDCTELIDLTRYSPAFGRTPRAQWVLSLPVTI